MDEKHKSIEERVMGEIGSGNVKLRSRYAFLAEKYAFGSVFVLSLLLAALFFSLVLYYLQTTDILSYLSFGRHGFLAFLEAFPFPLVICLVFSIFFAGFMLRKNDISYKKPFVYTAVSMMGGVVVVGSVLAFTDIIRDLEDQARSSRPVRALVKPLLHQRLVDHEWSVAGRVASIEGEEVLLETPQGLRKLLWEGGAEWLREHVTVGEFVVAVGEREEHVFRVRQGRVIKQDEVVMIKQGVYSRFGPIPVEKYWITGEIRICMENCLNGDRTIEVCKDECGRKYKRE